MKTGMKFFDILEEADPHLHLDLIQFVFKVK
jgi:hypothetical protein